MYENKYFNFERKCCIQQTTEDERYINTNDISVPPGYQIEAIEVGLNIPIGLVFTEDGSMIIADAGYLTGNPKVISLSNGQSEIIADGFNVPITGINYLNGDIYVSHKGAITVIGEDGTRKDIISGLPSFGDYHNNRVTFGQDGKIYFGQGTATNSGVVGLDNEWVFTHPYFYDYPGDYLLIKGLNYETPNILIPAEDSVFTGAFSPFGIPNLQSREMLKGWIQASGSVLRANLDGSDLELVAWGLRNPVQMNFDSNNRLFITNQGYDNRGSRPIANAPDEFQILIPGAWYGWPDYAGGKKVAQPRFTPEGKLEPNLLLANIPSIPPIPFAIFPSDTNIMGFDFNYNPQFGIVGDAYIAGFGVVEYDVLGEGIRSGVGHSIIKVDMNTGQTSTFAINKSGFSAFASAVGGFGRPTDVVFGPDGAMYITDFTSTVLEDPDVFLPNTGVLWRISKQQI
jgi:glucose/arabinose dehydrogenase